MVKVSGRYKINEIEHLGELLDLFSENVLDKAKDLVKLAETKPELLKQDAEEPHVWWVRSSSGDDIYRVQWSVDSVYSWVTCTCPQGMNMSQPRCYHVGAVLWATREAIAKALLKRRPTDG